MFVPDKNLFPGTPAKVSDPFSLEALVGWLEKQPGEKTYNWHNCRGECLLSQYSLSVGGSFNYVKHGMGQYENIAYKTPWTFGAALDRARSLLSEQSK